MGIAHREKDNTVLLDMVFEKRPPFNPSEKTEEIAALLKTYGLSQITGDRYAAQWVVEAFHKVGIKYLQSERDRSQIYLDTLPLFTAGRARLIDSPRLVSQFSALGAAHVLDGRDRVDHGRTGPMTFATRRLARWCWRRAEPDMTVPSRGCSVRAAIPKRTALRRLPKHLGASLFPKWRSSIISERR